MDEMLERLRSEIEEEKKRVYLARFGRLPLSKGTERKLRDFGDFN